MANHRAERVAEEVKKEVADILRNEIKDPRVGFVTITGVEVSGDLRYVKIFVSVLGSKESKDDTLKALEKATGFIRREIGHRIKLRITPEISFKYDTSIEYGFKITEKLNEVNKGE